MFQMKLYHLWDTKKQICLVFPARIFRISFSGELAYEINVESGYGIFMWEKIMELGKKWILNLMEQKHFQL